MSSYITDDNEDDVLVLNDATLTTGGIVSDFVNSQDNSKTVNNNGNKMKGGHVAAIIFLIIFLIAAIILAVFMFIFRKKLYDMYKKCKDGMNSKDGGEEKTVKVLEDNKVDTNKQGKALQKSVDDQRKKLKNTLKDREKNLKSDSKKTK